MLIIFHIVVALTSLGFTAYAFFLPSKSKVRMSQALTAATLGSGTYLVASTHASMVDACLSGLIYTAVVTFGIVTASGKLTKEKSNAS